MKNRFHGVFSLVLIVTAVVVALIFLFTKSFPLGILYLALIIISSGVVLFAYCSKCTCRSTGCSHVFPGKLTRFLPVRKDGPYTSGDIPATSISLLVLFLFPQYWLWQNTELFVLFWVLTLGAVVEIRLFVCKECRNGICMMSPVQG